jgi:hypothetical protein
MDYKLNKYSLGGKTLEYNYFILKTTLTFAEATGKSQKVNLVPELNLDYILAADKTSEQQTMSWGIDCVS